MGFWARTWAISRFAALCWAVAIGAGLALGVLGALAAVSRWPIPKDVLIWLATLVLFGGLLGASALADARWFGGSGRNP